MSEVQSAGAMVASGDSGKPGPTGVLLLNMGGPDSLEAVEPFLYNLFSDNDIITLPLRGFLVQKPLARFISSRRARFVRGYYAKIGRRSPIAKITRMQATALERRLNRDLPDGDPGYRCYVGMRYWHPFTSAALAEMARDGVRRIVALTLYPHYTTATTESSLRDLRRQLGSGRFGALGSVPLVEIDRYPGQPRYLDAITRRVRHALAKYPAERRRGLMILFSAHGLPVSFIAKGDPYVDHLHTTIVGVMARLAQQEGILFDWRLSFQSRAGRAKWLEPSTETAIQQLAREGRRDVLAVPISFVSDHIETLYEIDMLFGDEAKALGLDFRRATALNGEALYTEALAELVEERIARTTAMSARAPSAHGA
jgi:ferrochelatase